METTAEDYEIEEGVARVVTARDEFLHIASKLESDDRHIDTSDLQFFAENTIELDATREEKLQRLIDILEEDEDVDTVRHNAA